VRTVVAAKPGMIARLFGMPREAVSQVADELLAKKILKRDEDWLIANE
jgi:hypothetical protein